MKIVVIGGTGLIGSKVVQKLQQKGMRRSPPRRTQASTPSPEKAWPRRSKAPMSSYTERKHAGASR
jgi:uncharacterized protein YbjT (DUF2867 family)